ncbi:MAG: Fur family transcriptional regulator [Bryobacteraceae bacterium]
MSSFGAELRQAFCKADVRPTVQRYAVLQYLAGHGVHATAEEIFRAVNRQDPRASRATVYNSLKSLARGGLVREVASAGKAARFDASLHPHHHFVCERCGEVEDIAWFELPATGQPPLGGRRVRSFEVVFRGVCEKCGGSQPLTGEKA